MARNPAVNRNPRANRAVHPDRAWVRLLRLALGVAAFAGVGWNFYRAANGMVESTLIESISQFTNQANLVFGLVLVVGALRSRDSLPAWWDDVRGAAAFYMVMTGLIYAILVAEPGELARWDLEWSNILLHRITPTLALVGWLVVTMTRRGTWGRPLAWLAYPVLYLTYTWVRGSIVGWYPYGFLDPTGPGGWGDVLATTAQVFVAFLVIAVVLHVLGMLRASLAHRGRVGSRSSAEPVG
ncbi:Pr6Pr family membrane protein [Gulosibacter faecalis]|jgi:hypothetical protein|uniref:Pr6Pr family membrane protein n=1 Tax=Gulosibacter faecalis TaxID=272240 RepID=A0ABW5V1L9_9MICO|nr:Pr6Pr family membrane protein [Gulosibacter faecalis]